MHDPEPVLENEIHNILGDFEIQTDHLISARPRDSQKKKKKKKRKEKENLLNSEHCRSR